MSSVDLRNEHACAVITPEVGGTLRSLRVKVGGSDHELLSGGLADRFDEPATPSGSGSFIMAPWVNRIHRGRLLTEHGEFSLPLDHGEHAIHGTVRQRAWDVVASDGTSAELRIDLAEPWPFAGHVVYRVALDGPALRQTLEVHAADGERRFPAGVGWHPWFRRSLGSDESRLQADVIAQWELDSHIVPTGELAETDATRTLIDAGWFEVGEVDGCFQLAGERTARVRWPELTLRMSSSAEISHVMVYSPAESVCVEPQTTAVNAFQLEARGIKGNGTRFVSSGSPLVATTTWSWSGA
jgi:aldose 1-epimerase